MNHQTTFRSFVVYCLCLSTGNLVAEVTFDWATVGNPGNGGHLEPGHGTFGAVSDIYRISKYEVTNAQYTEFLNAVDPRGENRWALYKLFMSTSATGGIDYNRDAANGSKFQFKAGHDNNPVNFVSFFDAIRFTNWLQNGQGSGSTESGVYTIGNGVNETRNPGATYFIPDDNEWYKAAYHKNDGVTANYWEYPTSTDAEPYSDQPPGSEAPTQSNTANFFKDDGVANSYDDGFAVTGSNTSSNTQNYLTDVGSYTASLSPYGTFDQGGNVLEWTETVIASSYRSVRGGGFGSSSFLLSASDRYVNISPFSEWEDLGFRVARVGSVTADLNGDGSINCADVDSLVAEVVAGLNSASFDLTGDGLVNIADLDEWRLQGGAANLPSGQAYLEGDANLDGAVDGSDFSIWNTHKFTNVAAWCSGDFNASGSVDGSDFSIWSAHKFTSSASASAVPEPCRSVLLVAALIGLAALRGGKKGVRTLLCKAPAGPFRAKKGVRTLLCKAPAGPFRQKGPDPFFLSGKRGLTPFFSRMKTIIANAFLRLALLCAAVASCALPFRTAQAAQFIPLGWETYPVGVSGDGAFVVGTGSLSDALRWTSSGQVQNLGDAPGALYSSATAASLTGSVVVGDGHGGWPYDDYEAFRWTESAGMQGLGSLPGDTQSQAWDVSADGSIVIGSSYTMSQYRHAYRWTDGAGMVGLGTLPGFSHSDARGISADGLVIAGRSHNDPSVPVGEAFRWTEAGGMQGLGALPGDIESAAWGISADGSTIVGASFDSSYDNEAFRWTAGTGMVGLGRLGFDWTWATGVSGDGSVVVGRGWTQPNPEEALIWDETHGMRRLKDVLTAEGLDLTGWRLTYPAGISDDGNVIAGRGVNPSGAEEGWIARLNTVLGDPDFNNDGQLNCTDIDALVAEIAAGTNSSLFDLTGDGLVDIADLDEWRVQGGAANLASGNPYLEGDANLDGAVDGSDFSIWNTHKFTNVAAWCSGDFNASGSVDGSDFSIWSSNKFTTSASASAVPEPCISVLLVAAMIGLAAHREKKGVRTLLCKAPAGPFRQKGPDPFFLSHCPEKSTFCHRSPAVPALRLRRPRIASSRSGIIGVMTDVTRILSQIESGDPSAAEQLLPLVYKELRKLAAAKMADEKPGQTMQATGLVHEAYIRLVDVEEAQHWNSRGHFFGAAAEAMRRILVEQARKKHRVRHGGDFKRIELRDVVDTRVPDAETILAVNDALNQLTEQESDVAEIVKLHFFAGLTLDETADALALSRATVYRQWAYARACLRLMMRAVETDSDG